MQQHADQGWMIYGAYGYTGQLVARRAVAAGYRPVLAGRDPRRLARLAAELECSWRSAPVDDPGRLRGIVEGIDLVANCAGPFARTAATIVDACLRQGAHYLDITGELDVLEHVLDHDRQARAAGVVLLPGCGFDVVPTDCLANLVADDLDGSVRSIELAFLTHGSASGGTMRTAIAQLHAPSLCVRDGKLVPVPTSERRRDVDYASRVAGSTAISWGDLATAPRSTGARDVTVYMALPRKLDRAQRLAVAVLAAPGARSLLPPLLSRAAALRRGPDQAALAAPVGAEVWARATGSGGGSAERRLVTPNPYALTADAVVRIAASVLAGRVRPGAHTPAQALGSRFVLELDGVELR